MVWGQVLSAVLYRVPLIVYRLHCTAGVTLEVLVCCEEMPLS